MSDDVTKYISKKPGWQQEMMQKLRKLMHESHPEIAEQLKWGAPWFSYDGKPIAWMFGAKTWVHFSLMQGSLLEERHGLFEPTDNKAVRTIKFRQDQEVPEKLITKLVKDSIKIYQEGREIKFKRPKPGSRVYDVPHEYESLLKENGAWEKYVARPYYQKKGYVEWIEQAKQAQTRDKRIKTMLSELDAGTYMPPKRMRK